jgi:hypothetical protein
MLVSLSIRDFVLIEKLDLDFVRSRNGGLEPSPARPAPASPS